MPARIRILLVDDDDVFFDLVRWIVDQDAALSSTLCLYRLDDGEAAIDFFRRRPLFDDVAEHPWPDLLLLDQRMPRIDGTEVLRRLRGQAATRALPVGMLSSSSQEKLVREAYEAGANFYFVKPLQLEDLRLKLRKIADFMSTVAELPARRE